MAFRIYLSSPNMSGDEQKYIKEAFDTNWVAPLGANVDGFEREMLEYINETEKGALALSAGTAAIHLALKAAGVGMGDKVICSSLTFAASANPICYEKAIPVFIDSEESTWNMDPKALEMALKTEDNVKAVICANLYGQSADMDPIVELCHKYNVTLIEDAAESLGATYHGKASGTFGDYGIFSFNGNKIITTSGGGMLIGPKERIEKARFWSTQARDKARHYQHSELGYNYRMSNILAGIGRGQLEVLDLRIAQKTDIYKAYVEGFAGISDITVQPEVEGSVSNHWLTCILIDEKSKVKPDDIMDALLEVNIESRPIWKPLHMQPYYEKYAFYTSKPEKPVSEEIFARGVCLPSDTRMTKEDLNEVIGIISKLFN